MFDLVPPEAVEGMRAQVAAGNGWGIPFPGVEALAADGSINGIGDAERARMEAGARPHPFGSYEGKLRLTGEHAGTPKMVVIACEDFRKMLDDGNPWLTSIIDDSWTRFDLSTGHWPMFSIPKDLANVLARVAEDR